MYIPYSASIAVVVGVIGVVVGREVGSVVSSIVASAGAAATAYVDCVDWNDYDEEQHSADNGGYIESNACASQSLLFGSLALHGYDGQDEGRYGAKKADEGGTTEQQDC